MDDEFSLDIICGLCDRGLFHVIDDVIDALDPQSLCQFELTCTLWRSLVQDDRHWRKKFVQAADPDERPDTSHGKE